MILIRPRVLLVVGLSVMIFTSTATILASLQQAPSSFAANRGFVISSPGAPTVFSSSVNEELADAINSTIQQASPEVFAFTSFSGVPFVVRGVDLAMLRGTGPSFISLERPDGGTGLAGNDALIGSRLKERLDIDPPFNMSITSSYSPSFRVVSVVGWFESDSALDDELLAPLDVARSLSGMADGKVSIIRVGGLSSGLSEVLMPSGPEFAIYGLGTSDARPVIGEQFTVKASVKNWGTEKGTVDLTVTDEHSGDRNTVLTLELALEAGEEFTLSRQLNLTFEGLHTLQASIGVEDHDSQSLAIEVVPPYLLISCPSIAGVNSTFDVTVTDHAGSPVEGAEVTFMNQSGVTDLLGKVRLNATTLGDFTVNASHPGFSGQNLSLSVEDFSTYPNEFNPVVVRFSVVPFEFNENQPGWLSFNVVNEGRLPGNFVGAIKVDGDKVFAEVNLALGPGEMKTASYVLTGIGPGQHTISLNDGYDTFQVAPWYSDDPGLVLLAVRYGGTAQISSVGSIPIVQAAKISQGNIEVALVSIGAISAVLAALSVTSIFSKEVHEGRRKLGIMRTIGASRRSIRMMVVGQSLAYSIPGAVAGAVLGLALAMILLQSGSLMMFGHSLVYDVSASTLPAMLIGIVAICIASSLASAEVAVRATPISSIRGTEDEIPERKSVDEILGDE